MRGQVLKELQVEQEVGHEFKQEEMAHACKEEDGHVKRRRQQSSPEPVSKCMSEQLPPVPRPR